MCTTFKEFSVALVLNSRGEDKDQEFSYVPVSKRTIVNQDSLLFFLFTKFFCYAGEDES